MKLSKVIILVATFYTMAVTPKVIGGPQDKKGTTSKFPLSSRIQESQRERQSNLIRNSVSAAEKGRKTGFDLRRMEQQETILKKIQDGHAVASGIQRAQQRVDKIRSKQYIAKASSLKKAKVFGKATRFLEAPPALSRLVHADIRTATNTNVLVNGKTQDSLFIGDPLTLTFSLAPGAASATLTILVDVNGNAVADSSDILIMRVLLLDNDDSDGNPANGSYELRFATQDFITHFIGSLIFEVNDYQAVSSAVAVVRQRPTSSLVLGSVTPPFPHLAFYISGSTTPIYVFSDAAGDFSFYVDRDKVTSVTISQPIDVVGVANGYIPPTEQTKLISSDTTNVSVVFSLATSFAEGYVRDQTGAAIVGAKVYASGIGFYTRTRTDSNGYYKVGVSAGNCSLDVGPPESSDYMRVYSSSQSLYVPANATVQHDMSLIRANSKISGKVTLDGQGVAGVPITASSDSLSNSVVTSAGGSYSLPVYNSSAVTLKYTVSTFVTNGFYISVPYQLNIQAGAVGVDFAILRIAGGIQGRITDRSTGLPIANAQVSLSGINYKSTVSNDSGYYRISLLDGMYSMYVYADRYYEYVESSISIAGAMVSRNVALQKSGSISGTTKDVDGNPIPNASIYASSSSDSTGYYSGYGYSDTGGKYVLSGLRSSRYRVQCSKYGYMTEWYDNVTDWQNASLVQVNDGSETPNINFVLSRGGSISGKVTDKSGMPIALVEIDVYDTAYSWRSYAVTDDSGYYIASGLASGKYLLRTYSYIYFEQWYDGVDSFFGAKPVSVMIDQNTPDINFTLSAGSSISGTVKTKLNVPIPYASISVLDSAFSIVSSSSTYDSGSYVITRLKPGKKLYAYASAGGYASKWYNNVSTPDSATSIILKDGETRANIDFNLSSGGSIAGTVMNVAGQSIQYANLYVTDTNGLNLYYGYSNEFGNYTVSNIPPGKYIISATGYGYVTQWYDHKSSMQLADSIVVEEDKTVSSINFDLKPLPPPSSDSIIVKLSLANIPDTLIFSRTGLPDYYVDYWWGIRIDVDRNPNTGYFGCEMDLAIYHYKSPGDQEYRSDIINGTYHNLLEIVGDNEYVRQSGLTISRDPSDKNTLVIKAPKSWTELADVTLSSRYYVHAFTQTTDKYGVDLTVASSAFEQVTDPSGDVTPTYFDYVDILRVTPNVVAAVEDIGLSTVPPSFSLKQNYPNPFNPSTTIEYGLPQQSRVSVKVYSVLGQEVRTLVNDVRKAGFYQVIWNGRDNNGMQVSSGVYFFRIVAQPNDGKGRPFAQVRKMLLTK